MYSIGSARSERASMHRNENKVETVTVAKNAGFCFLENGQVRVRLFNEKDCTLGAGELPEGIESLILTIRDKYSYLFA